MDSPQGEIMTKNNNSKTIKIRILNPAMGVPITYLDKHNPEQFEVVAFRKGNDGKDLVFTRERVQPYFRILIRRRVVTGS